ncbi:lysin A [Mycobacterium phage ToneTone]|nr:lysin A [Mycobacterium phage ToneTone]
MALGAPMENGWPECDLSDCDYATVPGTPLRLPFRKGHPFIILQAFLRDLNEFVEPLMNARGATDEGSWTDNNSVYTSNHKGATAFDYNWSDHPMGNALAGWHGSVLISGEQEPAVRELLRYYTYRGIQLVWWGNDWYSPKDSMHFQMGYDTVNNPAIVQEFIGKFIRPDGYSTYRRGSSAVVPTELTVPLTPAANGRWTSPSPAWAHLIMRESGGNPTIIQQIHDVNSGGNEAEGLFQITPRTWKAHNGTDFATSARFATPQQQAIVAARIITRNPSGSDWGAGLPGREDAAQLRAGLVPTQTTNDPLEELMAMEVESFSIYATPGEPKIPVHVMIQSLDAHGPHEPYIEEQARHGDRDAIFRVARTAAGKGKYGDAPGPVKQASRVLKELEEAGVLAEYLKGN